MNRWGFLKLVHLGNKHDPNAYKPLARTFRPLTDASYASDLPANLAALETLTAVPTLSRAAGEVAPKGPARALTPSIPNTS